MLEVLLFQLGHVEYIGLRPQDRFTLLHFPTPKAASLVADVVDNIQRRHDKHLDYQVR